MSTEPIVPSALIVLHASDNVAVARVALAEGATVPGADGAVLHVHGAVPAGHKIALRHIACGEVVRKYGQPIGVARLSCLDARRWLGAPRTRTP